MTERWRIIPMFDGRYQMSNIGRVRCVDTQTLINPTANKQPLFIYRMSNMGISRAIGVKKLFKQIWPEIEKEFGLTEINKIRKMNGKCLLPPRNPLFKSHKTIDNI